MPYLVVEGERLAPFQINAMLLRYRFLSKVKLAPETGCWIWQGNPEPRGGYGVFWNGIKNARAHRWAYEHFIECLPVALVLDHLCRNRLCVNPEHLEPVMQRTNVLRGEGLAAKQARRTHCIYGHPFSGDNLARKSNGGRKCIACQNNANKRRRAHADA